MNQHRSVQLCQGKRTRAPRHRSQQGILSERHISGVWSQLSHRMERQGRRAQHLST